MFNGIWNDSKKYPPLTLLDNPMRSIFTLALFSTLVGFSFDPIRGEAQERSRQGGRGQAVPGKEAPHPPKVGEQAPDFELKSSSGDIVSLKKLTTDSPVVLLVLRGWPGYQCPICSRQVGEFLAKNSEFEKAGVQLVLVYPGPIAKLSDHAKEFQEKGKWTFPKNVHYVTDPDYTFTNAWGIRWEAERETSYPSTFLISKSRRVEFAATSTTHGGRAGVAKVLEELAKLK